MLDLHRNDNLGSFFLGLDKRQDRCAYFYRIPGWNDEIKEITERCYRAATTKGTVIPGKIPNPDESQIRFFMDMLGNKLSLDSLFIGQSVGRWLPSLNNVQCMRLTNALLEELKAFIAMGKNDAMTRNLYVRLMCWMYYRFGSLITHIGDNEPAKILCGGRIGRHELALYTIFCKCGIDIMFLQYGGESEYDALDPKGALSKKAEIGQMQPFPDGFDLSAIEKAEETRRIRVQIYGGDPGIGAATNVWLDGDDIIEDIKKVPVTRGKDKALFYNAFCRISGVKDKLTYQNELYKFYLEIKNSGRRFVVINDRIDPPQPQEVAGIDRSGYPTVELLVQAMLRSVKMPANESLRRLIRKSFLDVLIEESEKPGSNMQHISNAATCAVCWFNRCCELLFSEWSMPLVSLFIYFGPCTSSNEAVFLRILSHLPCDVLILVPNLNMKCQLEDKSLYELSYDESLNLTEFPTEAAGLTIATVAYHAERELDTALYSGTGLYRDYQYKNANSVILKTMYEEISILWDKDIKFRPNFSVVENTVTLPVIFAKISGVKDQKNYWKNVQALITDNTFIVYGASELAANRNSPIRRSSVSFLRGGRLDRQAVTRHRDYRYSHLRSETQQYIFDKIDLLITSKIIAGTYENGMEYTIAATLLDLPVRIVNMIQGFDFTKLNPKLVYINVWENPVAPEDAILMAFLSLIGFDVLMLVPTGYQTVERYFGKSILDEHQVGEYMYDMEVPKLKIPKTSRQNTGQKKSLFGKLFRKGN